MVPPSDLVVIPAKAGIPVGVAPALYEIPAFAGMTRIEKAPRRRRYFLQKIARSIWTCNVEAERTVARRHGQHELQKATALTLSLDHVCNVAKHAVVTLEFELHTVGDRRNAR